MNIIVGQTAGMKLSNKPAWYAIKQLLELSKPFNGTYRMKGILYQLVPYASNKLEDTINEIASTCHCSIDYAIEYALLTYSSRLENYLAGELLPGKEQDRGRGRDVISAKTEASVKYLLDNLRSSDELVMLSTLFVVKSHLRHFLHYGLLV